MTDSPDRPALDAKPCLRARRGPKRVEHQPHTWTSGDEHVGDDTFDYQCPGYAPDRPALDTDVAVSLLVRERDAIRAERDAARTALRGVGDAIMNALIAEDAWEVDGRVLGNVGGIQHIAAQRDALRAEKAWHMARADLLRDDLARLEAENEALNVQLDHTEAAVRDRDARIDAALALCDNDHDDCFQLVDGVRAALESTP